MSTDTKNYNDLEQFYAEASHPEEAVEAMQATAVVALGTALWT